MASVSDSDVSDGPVLTLMSKRLRALKKKYNRILQLEENYVANKKPLNKEQEDLLSSKSTVAILIDEYEKLRQPLAAAVQEEISKSSTSVPAVATASDDKSPELEDVLGLIYFSSLFDVKPQSEFTSTMLTRTHERGCCLTYDYVTDDATDLLGERDLDMISALGTMLTSRPVYSGVSHREALEGCVRHAALWLRCAEQPISPASDFTYADLREKLKKIMASDYFTTTPEMKVPVDVAAAVGTYGVSAPCQVQAEEEAREADAEVTEHQQQHRDDDDQEDVQATEVGLSQSSPVDISPKDEMGEFNTSEVDTAAHQEPEKLDVDSEYHNLRDTDDKEQHQSNPRRQYQNQRGGNRGNGGGRRGRGSRGGRGSGYQNGRSQQQYYESGYYPRNYYNPRGRGGGGGGRYNSNHGAPTDQDSHVELGAS